VKPAEGEGRDKKKSRETKERRERERRKKTQRIKRVSFLHPCVTVRREIITEERKRRKTEAKTSKERDKDAELNAGDGRKQRTDGKGLKQTNTDRSASRLQHRSNSFISASKSVIPSFGMHSCIVIVQVNYNSLKQ